MKTPYKLSPSKAHRFLNCTASLLHDTEFVENIYTIRGNKLHTMGEMLIKGEDITDFCKENDINSYEHHFLTSYANAVINEYNKIDGSVLEIEVKRPINIFGFTSNSIIDALALSYDTASIIDLKTGRYEIDPVGNEQLYFYAYSIIMAYPSVKKVRLSIYQTCKMKTIEMGVDEILDFFMEKAEVFESIANDNLTYTPNEKSCKFCAIKDTCKARAEWILGGKKSD